MTFFDSNSLSKRIPQFLFLFIMVCTSNAHAGFYADFRVSSKRIDNVTNTSEGVLEEDDTVTSSILTVGGDFDVGQSGNIRLIGEYEKQDYSNFDGLSNDAFSLDTSYKKNFGAENTAWFRLFGGVTAVDYEADIRDENIFRAGASIGKRFGENFDAELGYKFKNSSADNDVFDSTENTVFGDIGFTLNDTLYLYSRYSVEDGDVVVSSFPSTELASVAEASILDPVFPGQVAYLLDSTTQRLRLGINIALNDRMSFDVVHEIIDSSVDGGNDFTNATTVTNFVARY